ncbi:MAG: sigma-54 interaction domain-containing protein [Deferribacterales bacterium]
MVNEKVLHDALFSIFRSDKIDSTVANSFLCFKKYMPIDLIQMDVYMEESKQMLTLCRAESGKIVRDQIYEPPAKTTSKGNPMDSVFILTDLAKHLDVKTKEICRLDGNSSLTLECKIGDRVLGFLSMKAYKEFVYDSTHKELFRSLAANYTNVLLNELISRGMLRLENSEPVIKKLRTKSGNDPCNMIIGSAGGLKKTVQAAFNVAPYCSAVLLTGETGVGKEVFANYIHNMSNRRHSPFIKLNCGTIPDSLIDNELFGHDKGAFTGADSIKKGRFELANEGTLFLDEVAELPLASQAKLLRALQFGEIERLGSGQTINVNTRIIAATNKDLAKMVKNGEFREDLFWRLNVVPIHIPPLRERREDIPLLAEHIIDKLCCKLGLRHQPYIPDEKMMKLMEYNWPGNVRELENLIERELVTQAGSDMSFESISSSLTLADSQSLHDPCPELDDVMKEHIIKTLNKTNWRISGKKGAANILGLHPNTLRNKMKKLGIL